MENTTSFKDAIYDPLAKTWTSVPPAQWQSTIGDAQSVVLANGTYMQANCCTTQGALLDPNTLTWTATGRQVPHPTLSVRGRGHELGRLQP